MKRVLQSAAGSPASASIIKHFSEPERPWQLKPSASAWQELAQGRAHRHCSYIGDDPVDLEFAATAAVPFHWFGVRSPSYGD